MAEIKNLYLICGDEQYLKEKKKKELLKLLHAEGSMNFHVFENREFELSEAARLSLTVPFLAEYRTLLFLESGFLKGAVSDELMELLEELPESTVLIFYEKETDANNRLYKLIKERGTVYSFRKAESKPFKEAGESQAKIRSWAANYLRQNRCEMNGRAMTRLLQLAGYDMLNLQSELEKLIAYSMRESDFADAEAGFSPKSREISEKDVELICSRTVSDKVFEMLSAKLQGNIRTALSLFEDLIAVKVAPMRVLYMTAKQFNQVYLLKELSRERIGDAELSEKLRIKDWQLRKLKEQSRKLSAEEARRYLELCVEMETKVKTGDLNDKLAVEILLAS